MGKGLKCLALAALMATSTIGLAGCGQKEVSSIVVVNDSYTHNYLQNSEYSFEDLIVTVKYNDGSSERVTYADLTIGNFDTSRLGPQEVSITYKGKTVKITLNVTNDEDLVYEIMGFELPSQMVSRSVTEYYVKPTDSAAELYAVGDDNAFHFLPNISVLNDDDEQVPILKYKSVSKVYIKDNGTYRLLEGTELATYVAIDESNSNYDFTQTAVGRQFKLEVMPYYYDAETSSYELHPVVLELRVVDGINVTNARQLGVINNARQDATHLEGWKQILSTEGFTDNQGNIVQTKGVVLHNNIDVKVNDIPDTFLEACEDYTRDNNPHKYGGKCLKDREFIYRRQVAPGENFNIYGNYFNINSDLPVVSADVRGEDGSNSSLFKFDKEEWTGAGAGTVTIKDLSMVGNTGAADTTDESKDDFYNRYIDNRGYGGIIGTVDNGTIVNFENVLARKFFLSAIAEEWDTTVTTHLNLNKVKFTDAYQNHLFVWSEVRVDVTNSLLQKAGGPAILAMQPDPDENESQPEINVTNSTIVSNVSGQESWFKLQEQTGKSPQGAALQLIQLSEVLKLSSSGARYFSKQEQNKDAYMNLVSIIMPDGGRNVGKLEIDGDLIIDLTQTDRSTYDDVTLQGLLTATKGKAPIFIASGKSGELAYAYFDGTEIVAASAKSIFNEDSKYLTIFFMGMAITVEYFLETAN